MQDSPVMPPQWQFQPHTQDATPSTEPQQQPAGDSVQWTASEFLAHQKSGKWYVLLILAAVVVSAFIYGITRDWMSSSMVVIVAVLFAIVAGRKPRTLQYGLSSYELVIQEKHYPLANYKSFSVINEGAINSIMLIPIKRFAQGVSMYYAPEDEGRIINVLSAALPYEERQQDPVDRLMQRIRF